MLPRSEMGWLDTFRAIRVALWSTARPRTITPRRADEAHADVNGRSLGWRPEIILASSVTTAAASLLPDAMPPSVVPMRILTVRISGIIVVLLRRGAAIILFSATRRDEAGSIMQRWGGAGS